MNTYHIALQGQILIDELNAMSPVQMTPVVENQHCTAFTICTDQSGMLGLLRHLHNLGIVIVSCEKIIFTAEKKRRTSRKERDFTGEIAEDAEVF
jgi:hypothetical protein